jgi:hypothetical protein
MALDIHAYVANETAFLAGAAAGPFYSTGADYSASVPGSTGSNDAGGVIIEVTGAFGADNFDAIVQTAVENASPSATWVDTNSRVNGIVVAGQYQLHITDPILSRCRLKIVKNAGAADVTWTIRWMSDRAVAAI